MSDVLVLQSSREHDASSWVRRCLSSVEDWCGLHGYAYAFEGDDLLTRVPNWYADKVRERKPIIADLARLLWIAEALEQNSAATVVWLDADVYVMRPDHLEVKTNSSCVFGYEYWLQANESKPGYRVKKNVHNAYCAFRRGCPVLPFLIEAVQRMVRRVDPDSIAPQFVGPKLLTHLHNTVGFEVDPRFGAISPTLAEALREGKQAPLNLYRQALNGPMLAANLCGSLYGDTDPDVHRLIDTLQSFKSGLI